MSLTAGAVWGSGSLRRSGFDVGADVPVQVGVLVAGGGCCRGVLPCGVGLVAGGRGGAAQRHDVLQIHRELTGVGGHGRVTVAHQRTRTGGAGRQLPGRLV